MRIFEVYGRRLVEWLFLSAIGHGIILFLATRGIHPDKLVASMITRAAEAPIWADWIISGAFGLLVTFILEIFFWNRRSSLVQYPSDASRGAAALLEPSIASDTHRYMTAYEAIHYLADDTGWGNKMKNFVAANGMRKLPLFEAPTEFKRIAEQGRIHAVGRLNGVGRHIEIPETYWLSATINPISLGNRDISETMPTVPNPDGIPVYKSVRILRTDVERVWPISNLPNASSESLK